MTETLYCLVYFKAWLYLLNWKIQPNILNELFRNYFFYLHAEMRAKIIVVPHFFFFFSLLCWSRRDKQALSLSGLCVLSAWSLQGQSRDSDQALSLLSRLWLFFQAGLVRPVVWLLSGPSVAEGNLEFSHPFWMWGDGQHLMAWYISELFLMNNSGWLCKEIQFASCENKKVNNL